MVRYTRLWETMEKRGMSQYRQIGIMGSARDRCAG